MSVQIKGLEATAQDEIVSMIRRRDYSYISGVVLYSAVELAEALKGGVPEASLLWLEKVSSIVDAEIQRHKSDLKGRAIRLGKKKAERKRKAEKAKVEPTEIAEPITEQMERGE